MTKPEEKAFQSRIERVETLVGEIERFEDPAARATCEELVQAVMALHGAGLERLLDLTWEKGEVGQEIIDDFGRDTLLRSLLLLHGLHPLSLEARVVQALDKVRPYLASHGGNVELLDVDGEGVVRLRLQGSCHGCPSSAMTLKLAIEEAVQEFAPDVARMMVEGVVEPQPAPPSGFIPLTQVRGIKSAAKEQAHGKGEDVGRWESVGDLASLVSGSLQVNRVSGHDVLFCRLENTTYAYNNTCPRCGHGLASSKLAGATLTCECGHSYDIMRAGRCLDQPNLHLQPFPLLVESGQARVALPG